MHMKRLRDFLLTLLGLWLILSPGILHLPSSHVAAVWNTWILGAALILLVSVSRYLLDVRTPLEDIAGVVIGFWLMIAPWVLDFDDRALECFNSIVTGFIVAALALWATIVDAGLFKARTAQQHPLP
jgi:SPW repeat